MTECIKNLVFSGGSLRGVAFYGAIAALSVCEKEVFDIGVLENVGGCSVGAIAAATLALGLPLREIKERINNVSSYLMQRKPFAFEIQIQK